VAEKKNQELKHLR